MLVWMTLVAGIAVCLLGVLAVVRVDRRWRRRHLRCVRCHSTWYSARKLCDGCGARGQVYDRQAHLVAGPVGVPGGGTDVPPARSTIDFTADVWSAPAARVPAPDRSGGLAGRR